jgi:hypothetical protein
MDESEVEPDSDMKTHQVNDMTAEDLTVRIRYSSQNNDGNYGHSLLISDDFVLS